MKLIYQDLLNFLSEQPSRESLSKSLFQLGHEHEIDGEIFDMEITPNRGDCLSLQGLLRDLNSIHSTNRELMIYDDTINDLDLGFNNLAPEDCPKISHKYPKQFLLEIKKQVQKFYWDGNFVKVSTLDNLPNSRFLQ